MAVVEMERLTAEAAMSLVESLERICIACLAATSQETWDLLHRGRTCSLRANHDPGDEDDVDLPPPHPFSLPRALARRMASTGYRIRVGRPVCYYPAVALAAWPDHDPGDEHPVLIPKWLDGVTL